MGSEFVHCYVRSDLEDYGKYPGRGGRNVLNSWISYKQLPLTLIGNVLFAWSVR